jgi:hypothetical protein
MVGVYSLVKRTENKAMYKSIEGILEVFNIKVAPEQEIYGIAYPEREIYPNSEDFGKIAWCYNGKTETSIEMANQRYDGL